MPSKIERICFVLDSSHSEGCVQGHTPGSKVVSAEYTDACNFGNVVEWKDCVWRSMKECESEVLQIQEITHIKFLWKRRSTEPKKWPVSSQTATLLLINWTRTSYGTLSAHLHLSDDITYFSVEFCDVVWKAHFHAQSRHNIPCTLHCPIVGTDYSVFAHLFLPTSCQILSPVLTCRGV